MSSNIDIAFNPDVTKKRVLKFNNPTISVDGDSVNQQSDGLLSEVSVNTSIDQIVFTVYSVDATTDATAPLTNVDGYKYTVSMDILPNSASLPPGLKYTSNTKTDISNSLVISGLITNLSQDIYEFLVRASLNCYDLNGNLIRTDNTDLYCYFDSRIESENFKWDVSWLSDLTLGSYPITKETAYGIGIYNKGESISESLMIQNMKADSNFEIIMLGSTQTLDKIGLHVSSQGILTGVISITAEPTTYYFRIKVYEGDNESKSGYPPTENTIFYITINSAIVTDTTQSNILSWVTSSSYLGSQYESYSSIFSVSASNPSNVDISYSISSNSSSVLPNNMTIDYKTGQIMGICPYVGNITTYYFTVRASINNSYIERQFYFKIYPLFYSNGIFSLELPVTDEIRRRISAISWNTNLIPASYVYRERDKNFGRCINQNIYFVKGLKDNLDSLGYWDTTLPSTDSNYGVGLDLPSSGSYAGYASCFLDKLMNYHHPYDIEISGIDWKPIYDLDGNYIADAVYYTITDNMESIGGFDSSGNEVLVNDDKKSSNSIPQWNMESNDIRIFPASISNCRNDLIKTTNRINTPTYMKRPNSKPGIGLVKNEGLPMWMMNPDSSGNIVGFVPSIMICYCTPGNGSIVASNIKNSAYYNLVGETFTIDRYIIYRNTKTEIHFDFNETTEVETTFDCDNNNGIIDKDTGTWFDVSLSPYSSVVKFPPGDIG